MQRSHILTETAIKVNGWVKALDTTRPTTANLIIPQVSHVSGYADAIDIAGYSYRNAVIPWAQTHFPYKQITINECPGDWDDWKQVLEHPGVFSMFMWTGVDYLGESDNKWPGRKPWGDMLDLASFKLQGWNYFKSVWKDEPHISIGTIPLEESGFKQDQLTGFAIPKNKESYKWRDSNIHWNYKYGDPVVVEVCSNHSIVELLLNGKSLGKRSMSEAPGRIMRWIVPFKSGILKAKSIINGKPIIATLKTSTKAKNIIISSDNNNLKADAYDVAHIVIQLVDKAGNPTKTENTKVKITIEGPAKLLGVDSANYNKHQAFKVDTIETFKGRALAIIQTTKAPGAIKITVNANGFESKIINLKSH